jgi:hypothetical protein
MKGKTLQTTDKSRCRTTLRTNKAVEKWLKLWEIIIGRLEDVERSIIPRNLGGKQYMRGETFSELIAGFLELKVCVQWWYLILSLWPINNMSVFGGKFNFKNQMEHEF